MFRQNLLKYLFYERSNEHVLSSWPYMLQSKNKTIPKMSLIQIIILNAIFAFYVGISFQLLQLKFLRLDEIQLFDRYIPAKVTFNQIGTFN